MPLQVSSWRNQWFLWWFCMQITYSVITVFMFGLDVNGVKFCSKTVSYFYANKYDRHCWSWCISKAIFIQSSTQFYSIYANDQAIWNREWYIQATQCIRQPANMWNHQKHTHNDQSNQFKWCNWAAEKATSNKSQVRTLFAITILPIWHWWPQKMTRKQHTQTQVQTTRETTIMLYTIGRNFSQ